MDPSQSDTSTVFGIAYGPKQNPYVKHLAQDLSYQFWKLLASSFFLSLFLTIWWDLSVDDVAGIGMLPTTGWVALFVFNALC